VHVAGGGLRGDFLNAEGAKVSQRAQKRGEKEDKIEENIKENTLEKFLNNSNFK
jgi:broad-specificity NMP kinase